jgi:hypothetical protein
MIRCALHAHNPLSHRSHARQEAQLNEVLAASNLDPTALAVVTRKLEDVLDSKNTAIKDLQLEVARLVKAHGDTVSAYEARMKALGVPVDELGFTAGAGAAAAGVASMTIGRGPAGLVTART